MRCSSFIQPFFFEFFKISLGKGKIKSQVTFGDSLDVFADDIKL